MPDFPFIAAGREQSFSRDITNLPERTISPEKLTLLPQTTFPFNDSRQRSPEHRNVKRLREATPVYENTGSADSRLTIGRNASIPAYTTTVAGPSSFAMQSGEEYIRQEENLETSEAEGSVLFSETLRDEVVEGEAEGAVEVEGEDLGGDMLEESHEDADMAEPPHWLTEPHTLVTRAKPPDPETTTLMLPPQPPSLDLGDGDVPEEDVEDQQYSSGDTYLYEMDHRPILERTAVKKDIAGFVKAVKGFYDPESGQDKYHVVDRLGDGTFSSVYLARDRLHNRYDNEYWTGIPNAEYEDQIYDTHGQVKVALKKILVTSSPARIENELDILESLRGCPNVSQIITAFREEDQVIIVMPYHQSDDFRHFYKHVDIPHMQAYMLSLLRALKYTHSRGIVHRDVKPANFLFDYETGEGVLCDFGLAERYVPPKKATCQHSPATLEYLHGQRAKTTDSSVVEQALYDTRKRAKLGEGRVGFSQDDRRPAVKTNRAGTRGFRAPEVLIKCPDQTVSIDIWSAGVMLLSMLTCKFPVFNSNDDVEALMEIAALFGRQAMEKCAFIHNRTMISNVPTLDTTPPSFTSLITKLNPHVYTPPMTHPEPEDAKEHIETIDSAIDLCKRMLRLDSTSRITAASALKHHFFGENAEDDGEDFELLEGTDGKCGELHGFIKGQHVAVFYTSPKYMRFGQGIPPSRASLCPEHENWQVRTGLNPIHCCRTFEEIRRGFQQGADTGAAEDRIEEQILQERDENVEDTRLRPAF